MPKGRIRYSSDSRAGEVFAVLILKEKPTQAYSRREMEQDLLNPDIYGPFLKLCVEHDDSETLQSLRQGVLFVVRAIGMARAARETGISRMTLYRMLAKDGNPELRNFIKILHFIGMRPWVVDEGFIYGGDEFKRLRKQKPPVVFVDSGRRTPKRRSSDNL
jgi:probable addiction module antidote protein